MASRSPSRLRQLSQIVLRLEAEFDTIPHQKISPLRSNEHTVNRMINFEFKRSSRKCSTSGRAFSGGEVFYSVLSDVDGEMHRTDVSEQDWAGPPEDCIGWWKSRTPDLDKGQVYWAPKDILLSFFEHLIDQNVEIDTIYVMAILLLQKKHLRLLDNFTRDNQPYMLLAHAASKQKFEVGTVDLSPERIATIQNELAEKLFTDVAPTEE